MKDMLIYHNPHAGPQTGKPQKKQQGKVSKVLIQSKVIIFTINILLCYIEVRLPPILLLSVNFNQSVTIEIQSEKRLLFRVL